MLTLMMAHWLACLWAFVGRNSGDGRLIEDAPRDLGVLRDERGDERVRVADGVAVEEVE